MVLINDPTKTLAKLDRKILKNPISLCTSCESRDRWKLHAYVIYKMLSDLSRSTIRTIFCSITRTWKSLKIRRIRETCNAMYSHIVFFKLQVTEHKLRSHSIIDIVKQLQPPHSNVIHHLLYNLLPANSRTARQKCCLKQTSKKQLWVPTHYSVTNEGLFFIFCDMIEGMDASWLLQFNLPVRTLHFKSSFNSLLRRFSFFDRYITSPSPLPLNFKSIWENGILYFYEIPNGGYKRGETERGRKKGCYYKAFVWLSFFFFSACIILTITIILHVYLLIFSN